MLENGDRVYLPSGAKAIVVRTMGERVLCRYMNGEEVLIKPQLLRTVLPPWEPIRA